MRTCVCGIGRAFAICAKRGRACSAFFTRRYPLPSAKAISRSSGRAACASSRACTASSGWPAAVSALASSRRAWASFGLVATTRVRRFTASAAAPLWRWTRARACRARRCSTAEVEARRYDSRASSSLPFRRPAGRPGAASLRGARRGTGSPRSGTRHRAGSPPPRRRRVRGRRRDRERRRRRKRRRRRTAAGTRPRKDNDGPTDRLGTCDRFYFPASQPRTRARSRA